jgi:serine protease AprX
MSGQSIRKAAAAFLASLMLLALTPATGSSSAVQREAERFVSVIVQAIHGAPEARAVVESTGGQVQQDLPIINGVSAVVRADQLALLRENPRVWQVSPNDAIGFEGRGPAAEDSKRIQKVVRSDKLWSEGITGAGSTVALIDTGVYNHPDLAGRVVCGADFSHEAGTPAECQDTFGHGTFMAGLIAGNGASSNGKYKGTAPQANIVSVKAAGFDGSTDVSTILASIQWVVAHKDQYGIDALNLSLGSDSTQSYQLSPLNFAVEKAWQSGIVVVVSAGNSGPDSETVMKPGDDPYVITVGASNDEDTLTVNDDRVPVFSSRGPTAADGLQKPDIVSPGVHTTSLRSPGSAIDQAYGATAVVDDNYFKGTGTSMSTATVSGVVAQMLQRHPALTPDQVKYRLMATARPIADTDPTAVGAGLINAETSVKNLIAGVANQGLTPGTGLGSLQLDRGTLDIQFATPLVQVDAIGEVKAQTDPTEVSPTNPLGLLPFVAADYKLTGWDAASWDGTTWKTEDWTGTTWKGTTWKATVWDGTTWKGTTWKNDDWTGTTWKDADWDGTTWKGTTWKSAWYAAQWD